MSELWRKWLGSVECLAVLVVALAGTVWVLSRSDYVARGGVVAGERSIAHNRFRRNTPTPTAVPTVVPPSGGGGGITFAPFHFGEVPGDYDGVAGDIFNGAFVTVRDVAAADSLLPAAAGRKVLVNLGSSDPCRYWKAGHSDAAEADFARAVNALIPALSKYKDRVVGILMLNEPDNPDAGCLPVPAEDLYDAAALIRPVLEANGFAADFSLGYGVAKGSMYFLGLGAKGKDGTVNLSNLQYAPQKGVLSSFVTEHLGYAATVNHKLYFTVNAAKVGDDLTSDLVYICNQATADRVLMVGYWTWDRQGGNQAVPLTDLAAVRDACAAR